MNVEVRKLFVKDAERLPAEIQHELYAVIKEIEKADRLTQLGNCKKLKGFKTAYRIRVGQYRIGFFFEKDTVRTCSHSRQERYLQIFPIAFHNKKPPMFSFTSEVLLPSPLEKGWG